MLISILIFGRSHCFLMRLADAWLGSRWILKKKKKKGSGLRAGRDMRAAFTHVWSSKLIYLTLALSIRVSIVSVYRDVGIESGELLFPKGARCLPGRSWVVSLSLFFSLLLSLEHSVSIQSSQASTSAEQQQQKKSKNYGQHLMQRAQALQVHVVCFLSWCMDLARAAVKIQQTLNITAEGEKTPNQSLSSLCC